MEPADEELLARYGHQPAPPAEGEVVEGPTDEELWDIGERHLWTGTDESVTNYRILTSFIETARVVLARYGHQPAPPTEGEVADLIAWLGDEADQYDCIQQSAETSHKLRRAAYLLGHHHPALPTEGEVGELIERLNLISVGMDAIGHESDSWFVARAATLLKRRHPAPAPPAEGEVAELVAALRSQAIDCTCDHLTSGDLRRAADLLKQRHPEPVPVSERLPGPEDLDDKGECWEWDPTSDAWVLLRPNGLIFRPGPWLPANALPLPAGEVQP